MIQSRVLIKKNTSCINPHASLSKLPLHRKLMLDDVGV